MTTLEGQAMTLPKAIEEQIEAKAQQIVNEDGDGARWWINSHSCGMGWYDCCGVGKDIDKRTLFEWIRDEMQSVATACLAAGAAEARAKVLRIVVEAFDRDRDAVWILEQCGALCSPSADTGSEK